MARDSPIQNLNKLNTNSQNGVCFSFTALISATTSITILSIAVIFVLLKFAKKNSSQFDSIHY